MIASATLFRCLICGVVTAATFTVHADVTIALPLLANALAASARGVLASRKPLRFDLSGRLMAVEGRPFPEARFVERER